MWAAKRCGFYGQFWLILLEYAVLCCAMFRNCWYPPHMINFPATDWTCTLHIQRISLPHLPSLCAMCMCLGVVYAICIRVPVHGLSEWSIHCWLKWNEIALRWSPGSNRCVHPYAFCMCARVCVFVWGTESVRNINLCNVLILINFCWRCRKVTWMNRVYGNCMRHRCTLWYTVYAQYSHSKLNACISMLI